MQGVERDVDVWALRGQVGVGRGTETLRWVGCGQPLVLQQVKGEEFILFIYINILSGQPLVLQQVKGEEFI